MKVEIEGNGESGGWGNLKLFWFDESVSVANGSLESTLYSSLSILDELFSLWFNSLLKIFNQNTYNIFHFF
jgi:hypothetical protein